MAWLKKEASVPEYIKVRVYYADEDGKILIDEESMVADFDRAIQDLKDKHEE